MYRFDEKLGRAFAEALVAGISIQPTAPLKLETFLSALDRLFPEDLRKYFEDQDKLRAMCERSWPTKAQVQTHARTMATFSSEGNEPGTAPGFHIQLDPDFERILLHEFDPPQASGHNALSIQELITLITKDERTVAHLRSKWAVVLRATP